MKMYRIKKETIIVLVVVCAIFLIVGIVFALLPDEVYINWEIYNLNAKFYPLIACVIHDIFIIICAVGYTERKKREYLRIYNRASKFGEDSIALECKIIDRKTTLKVALMNIFSTILGALAALFFRFSVTPVYSNHKKRWLILCCEGLYVVNLIEDSEFLIKKESVQNIHIKEKRNKLVVELIPLNATFSVKTKKLDVTREELIAKFKEVFTNTIADQIQRMRPKTID